MTLELPPESTSTAAVTLPMWQWWFAGKPKLGFKDKGWRVYPQTLTDLLEEAYQAGMASINVTVNSHKTTIAFVPTQREVGTQRRVEESKLGCFVCKVRRVELAPTEAEAMMHELEREGDCSICHEYFVGDLTVERLQRCGHKFHTACLQVSFLPHLALHPTPLFVPFPASIETVDI